MATLHFIHGNPGAGKPLHARELARATPALFVCEDEWLAALGGSITSVQEYLDASRRVRGLMTACLASAYLMKPPRFAPGDTVAPAPARCRPRVRIVRSLP